MVDLVAPAHGTVPKGGMALLRRAADPSVRHIVRDYWGYAERTAAPLRRRELPAAEVILVVNLGAPLLVEQPRGARVAVPSGGGFVAGLHDSFVVTETAGSQAGIELRLSPPGAYRLLRQPMDSLVNRTIRLDDLLGSWAADLTGRLHAAATWQDRFAALDAALEARLEDAIAPAPEVVWAWRQLARSGGQAPMAMLADELGWSPKRLIARFREQIGLPPKQTARLLRFQRAWRIIAAGEPLDWGALARQCGYYDQSHLINEFRVFAGDTPQGLARRRLTESSGFAAD